ncbi:hypothetical protein TREMEDRAFT_25441 [Tremella mesenterica DSM 1558]|uniref:uncharacterized protein n=1 Tax=Tremella mesenterica (strain ATCC 24925 / CBS 8224 / DSM 1558 / NBRC 9311 / NRRL Y-6157 / RJB 2259-6 / UBC 559-6) TaxID=578456 RepID=UPI0003F4A4A1|nr:uncharacterized protein TREMEDRAFT_25441 [Tremella mesenterica DSM 1558]EIW71987.1 hypothetical protein TREMEDRAFT_25441 [Tremella mesenterica DSM 1558]
MEVRLASLPGGRDGEAAKRVRNEVEGRIAKVFLFCSDKTIQEETFRLARANLRVNGHNYEDFVEATEPFDEVLDRKIKALDVEKVGWDSTIADRRKKTPGLINRLEDNLEQRRTAAEWLPDDEVEDDKTNKVGDPPKPPRHKETIQTFKTAVTNLSELAITVPSQLARAQRAQAVREEISSMPS